MDYLHIMWHKIMRQQRRMMDTCKYSSYNARDYDINYGNKTKLEGYQAMI